MDEGADDDPKVFRYIKDEATNVLLDKAKGYAGGALLAGSMVAVGAMAASAPLLGCGMAASAAGGALSTCYLCAKDKNTSAREKRARSFGKMGGLCSTAAGTATAVAPWLLYPCPYMFPPLAWAAGLLGGGVTVGVSVLVALPAGSALAGSTASYYAYKYIWGR